MNRTGESAKGGGINRGRRGRLLPDRRTGRRCGGRPLTRRESGRCGGPLVRFPGKKHCVPATALGRRPVPLVLVGAVAISFSAILYRSRTSRRHRRVLPLPLGAPAALADRAAEERRYGPRPRRARLIAWMAGVFFAADLVLWHNAIEQVGAGLATVLGNTQVVLVGLLAWLLLGERPQQRVARVDPDRRSSASSSSPARSSKARTVRTRRSARSSAC